MMTLSMVSPGETADIASVRAGWGLQRRLAEMGLNPGVSVRVINNQHPGPIVLDVRGSRLALGHGIAHKIFVTSHLPERKG
ncbi:ferrous iron transport protein A [Chloroflexota bacterium]